MVNSLHVSRLIAPVAAAVVLVAQAATFGQTKSWNAENLAMPFPEPASEAKLIEQLRTAAPEDKVIACKQLAIYGGKAAVPELAKLLSDEQFSSWARIALEAIPDPSAEEALIGAAGELQGRLLVGVINSIGVKRSAEAVDPLVARLADRDDEVASAAAVALGKIGGERAVHALHAAYPSANPVVQSAIAEGGILWAEQLLASGKKAEAAEVYDIIRTADLPKQRILEATRGAILARGDEGIPLLVEQLQSPDQAKFRIALSTARELSGNQVVDAMCELLGKLPPERASLVVYSFGDRNDLVLPKSIYQVVASGDKRVRMAAVDLVGRYGDASAVPALLEIALDSDAEFSGAAKAALASLPGKNVNEEIAKRLPESDGMSRVVLIELVGKRRFDAAAELIKSLQQSDESIREAALVALGETVGPNHLNVLIAEVVKAPNDDRRRKAAKALHAASIRMPNRESTAAVLSGAMPGASHEAKASLLRILGAMGGPKALETIAAGAQSGNDLQQDAATEALGQWMTADAAPVLLAITKDPSSKKYHVRALRGYLRIARQLKQLPDAERVAMARVALEIAQRAEERELALDVLRRCPSPEGVELAGSLLADSELRDRAVETAIYIGEQLKDTDPAAAKSAGQKVLDIVPAGELAERARALTSP